MGPDAMILAIWMLNFKPGFFTLLFYFIKERFSSSSLSAIRVMSSAYLRFLIFLPEILIPACASSSPAFCMMYPAYKLNKQADSVQPWSTLFPILNQFIVPCPVLVVAPWSAYRYFRKQVRWSGIPISWRIFHSLLWSTQSKALVYQWSRKYMFFWNSFFFYDLTDVGNLISGSSAFSKSSLSVWRSRFTYCWSLAWSIILLACEMSVIVW